MTASGVSVRTAWRHHQGGENSVVASRRRWEQRGGIAKEVGTPLEQRDGIREQRKEEAGTARRGRRREQRGGIREHQPSHVNISIKWRHASLTEANTVVLYTRING
jgi:hypothetical protein